MSKKICHQSQTLRAMEKGRSTAPNFGMLRFEIRKPKGTA
jgi:hypothetical protein